MEELLEALIAKLMDKSILTAGDLGEIRADAMMRRETKKKNKLKQKIQEEILAILDNQTEIEIDAMGECYSVGEIAREVLLDVKNGVVKVD